MLEHLSIYTFFKLFGVDNIFNLDAHYVCTFVQRFEPQGRRFTNFHHYYYSTLRPITSAESWEKTLEEKVTSYTELS